MAGQCHLCERPATHHLGTHEFCDIHYEKATRQRGGLWRADFVSILLLVGFVILAYAVGVFLKPEFSPGWLIVVGVIMAVVPAAIWLTFFYRRDRLEPEPKGLVLEVFLLGGLVAGAIGIPVVDYIFHVNNWMYANIAAQILGGILVIGFTQEFLKYAAVRFSVYTSNEFDERTDGLIYATAAGLGYATALNIVFIIQSGGVDLGAGALRVTVMALAQASFAGIVGYFLAREKLEKKPVWWMPTGVALAAILNGLFFFLRGKITTGPISASGDLFGSWLGLALAAVLAGVTTFVLSTLTQRDIQNTLTREEVEHGSA